MKAILTPFAIVLSVAIVAGVVFDVAQKTIRNQAIDGCLQISVYRSQRTENGVSITTEEPIASAVQKCLDLKRIK